MIETANKQIIRVLLVEDDNGDALLVREMFSEIKDQSFTLTHADRMVTAMELLGSVDFDVILLDLSLPDGQGLDLVRRIRASAPETAIVVMSGLQDEELAVRLVQEGVQDYYSKGHVDSLLLGRAIRYAIERKRIEEELRRKNAKLAVLFQISSVVSRLADIKTLLTDVIDTITGKNILNLERKGTVLLIENGLLRLACEVGQEGDIPRAHCPMKIGECLCGKVVENGKLVVSADSSQDTCHILQRTGAGPHGHIVIPLKVRGQTIGVLCLYTRARSRSEVSSGERKLLMAIGEQIGIAVENAKLYEETRSLALHDPLTGLANRRHLDIVAEASLAMARRSGTPFSIIFLDLDHFKLYNDTHGHAAGDSLLVAIARTMKQEVRETTLVVRYGGEEFLILLPDTGITAATAVAERIRLEIQAQTGVTVSLGVAGATDASNSMTELIAAADAALYQAKNNGRNRVVAAALPRGKDGGHV